MDYYSLCVFLFSHQGHPEVILGCSYLLIGIQCIMPFKDSRTAYFATLVLCGYLGRKCLSDIGVIVIVIVQTDPSGIESATINDSDELIYNMKGNRMACSRKELQKGIYIQHGKKFVVK